MTERITVGQLKGKKVRLKKSAVRSGEVTRLRAFIQLVRDLSQYHRVILEHKFHDLRGWRFDVALPEYLIALEIDGGQWVHGAHHRPSGRRNDNEKDAEAQLLGWNVYRVSWEQVIDGSALTILCKAIESRLPI